MRMCHKICLAGQTPALCSVFLFMGFSCLGSTNPELNSSSLTWIQRDSGQNQRVLQIKYEYGESIADFFQVLGFAAFFALVLKKVEHEDEENTAIDGPLSAPGNCLQS